MEAVAIAVRSLTLAAVAFVAGLMLAAIATSAARAQSGGGADVASKTRSVLVYGDDPCPASTSDEIVVCARQPESERYRIPKRFRGRKAAASPAANSWSNKTRTVESASRQSAGVPNSCSAVGAAGQSGCFQQFQVQAAEAKSQADPDPDQPQ